MRVMTGLLAAAAALVVTAACFGQASGSSPGAPSAEEIVRRMQSNQVYETSRMRGRMTVTDRFGTKVTTFISYSRGSEDALIEFTSTEEKGQKILRTRDEIYIFYPGAEELIRLQGAAFRDAVLGSDMSYEDLTGGKSILELYEVSLEGRETRGRGRLLAHRDESEGQERGLPPAGDLGGPRAVEPATDAAVLPFQPAAEGVEAVGASARSRDGSFPRASCWKTS